MESTNKNIKVETIIEHFDMRMKKNCFQIGTKFNSKKSKNSAGGLRGKTLLG